MESKRNWLTKIVQVLGIATVIIGLMATSVRTIDLTQQTAIRQDRLEAKVDIEVNERKDADQALLREMNQSDKTTQAQFSRFSTEQAVMANDIKYIIKILDGGVK